MGASAFLKSVYFRAFAVNVKTIALKKYLYQFGHAIWNADLPMPLYSFFEEYDFSGKTIIPFVAHGGSGASGTVDTIAKLEPDATVVDNPVTVYWDELDDTESIVTDWVKSLNLTK